MEGLEPFPCVSFLRKLAQSHCIVARKLTPILRDETNIRTIWKGQQIFFLNPPSSGRSPFEAIEPSVNRLYGI